MTASLTPCAFDALGLSTAALDALSRAGFSTPTPIQQQAIPPALEGRDVIGCAATGTGKTAAFLLPIIERIAGRSGPRGPRGPRALVLAPTRELALQIDTHLATLGGRRGVRGVAILGGASMQNQIRALREGRELIVATPGRLVDHLEQGTARLDTIEVLVLDEADRMLDMGFRPQLERILARLPKKRQTMLFSATIDGEVGQFARRHLRDPAQVQIERSGTVARGATQCAYFVKQEADKAPLLLELLARDEETTLVFTRTQHRADKLAKTLMRAGQKVARIHGGRSQGQRVRALEGFRSGEFRVLVATDIAARGIDVAGIGHVVNYDVSRSPEDHVHRVGRTARAEAVGRASTLVAPEERTMLADVERFTRTPIERGETPADLGEWKREIERGREAVLAQHGGRRFGTGPAHHAKRGGPKRFGGSGGPGGFRARSSSGGSGGRGRRRAFAR